MKNRFIASMICSLLLCVGVSSVALPAQALSSAEVCPTSAGTRTTLSSGSYYTYDPALFTQSSVTDLVNCTTPFRPALVSNHQTPQDIELWFGPVPAAAFVGNTFTLRVIGTCQMAGYAVTMWVDKNVAHTTLSELVTLSNPNPYILFNGSTNDCLTSRTQNFSVTVTDTQKDKIQQGNFAILVSAVGNVSGSDGVQEQVTSVSIPYTLINLSYDANGGSGSISSQSTGLQTSLTANSFTRSGYTFSGWNTAANGSGTAFADTATATFSADTTLYAQWVANTVAPSTASAGDTSLAITGSPKLAPIALLGAFLVFSGISLALLAVARRRQDS